MPCSQPFFCNCVDRLKKRGTLKNENVYKIENNNNKGDAVCNLYV